MLNFALLIARKDLRITFSGTGAFVQSILLGLLLIFIFSVSRGLGESISPKQAAAIFWLGSTFCQILIFNQLYAYEEVNSARDGLVLSPLPIQGVWLGKAFTGLSLLFLAQLIFIPALVVFLDQHFSEYWIDGLIVLIAADVGMCALGSLLGALAQGQTGRESLLSIILFPLLLPLLLGAIALGSQALDNSQSSEINGWLGIVLAFDGIFIAASLVLFGFLYRGVGE